MADLGAVGTPSHAVASLGVLLGAPWWYSPFSRAIGVKNETNVGSCPYVGGRFSGAVPVDLVTVVVSDFGQAGGGVAIF